MKLLIIRPAALGDTLMLMPAIAQLRGSTEIMVVGRSPGIDIISPYVSHSIDYERSGWHRLFLENLDVDQAFSPPEADGVVAFLSDPDGNVRKNLKTCLPEASVYFFPAFPPEESSLHVASYLGQCLERTGLSVDPEKSLQDASGRPLLKREGETIQGKKIVLHPGSGGKGKNYPPDFWLELISALNSLFLSFPCHERAKGLPAIARGAGGYILLGPAEEALRPFFTTNLRTEGMEILFAPEQGQLQSILSQASLYVGHDSGITHLAAMLGTPTIALFKNTPVRQWRPLGPAVKVIQREERSPELIGKIIGKVRSLLMPG
jgi:ADP-heptose:LPS heptosyltransferase